MDADDFGGMGTDDRGSKGQDSSPEENSSSEAEEELVAPASVESSLPDASEDPLEPTLRSSRKSFPPWPEFRREVPSPRRSLPAEYDRAER